MCLDAEGNFQCSVVVKTAVNATFQIYSVRGAGGWGLIGQKSAKILTLFKSFKFSGARLLVFDVYLPRDEPII